MLHHDEPEQGLGICRKKMKKLLILFLLATSLLQALEPPTNLKAEWVPGGTNYSVKLTWEDNSSDETGFVLQRRIGNTTNTGWTTLTAAVIGANVTTWTDSPPLQSSIMVVYHYRLRAKNATFTSGTNPAQTSIAGITSTPNYQDSDADGLADYNELSQAFLNKFDWSDGSADHDGDGAPNGWEEWLPGDMLDPQTTPPANVLVDPQVSTETATVVKTITAALGKLTSITAHPNNSYRIIRVKPGVYRENISKTVSCNVAILPQRTSVSDHFEIQGTDPTEPIVSVSSGSFVLDGFVLSRAPGTRGPALSASEEENPGNRSTIVRLSNCLISNVDSGIQPLVIHPRGRLVLSHCTFYMNAVSAGSVAQSYGTGFLSGATGLETTARMRAQNCVFWNPVNIALPELQSAGEAKYVNCIAFQSPLAGMPQIPSGCVHINPGLTPKGYIAGETSGAITGGTSNLGVFKDIHGEARLDPPSRGADEWYDTDGDDIPDFTDSLPNSTANVTFDDDSDGLTDLVEYLSGTNMLGADSPYLTLHQANMLFLNSGPTSNFLTLPEAQGLFYTKTNADSLFYTKTEAGSLFYNKTQSDDRYLLKGSSVLRVSPAGDIGMGEFTSSPTP